jgi:hypothetical protein
LKHWKKFDRELTQSERNYIWRAEKGISEFERYGKGGRVGEVLQSVPAEVQRAKSDIRERPEVDAGDIAKTWFGVGLGRN